jgi:putative ABC transport system substrate-binding protein
MKRREFITLFGGAVATWPVAARAQQDDQIRRIGAIIGFAKNDPEVQSYVNAFDQGLKELGWIDGRNVRIDYRYAAGDITEMHRHVDRLLGRADLEFDRALATAR